MYGWFRQILRNIKYANRFLCRSVPTTCSTPCHAQLHQWRGEDRWLWKLSDLAVPARCLHSNQTLSCEGCDGMAGTANPVWLANQIWELQTNGCIISVSHVRAVCTLMLCHLSHLSVAGLQSGLMGERMRLKTWIQWFLSSPCVLFSAV